MALYRTVSMSFLTDSKVVDDFTPEDRYFYIYLFTNPHTNLCGCYEISLKQMSLEIGYNVETIDNLLTRFEQFHNVLRYSRETKEILILKWHKYNWTSSEKYRAPLKREIDSVKNTAFSDYLVDLFNGGDGRCMDTVSVPYPYGMDTSSTSTNAITDTESNSIPDTTLEERSEKPSRKSKPKKHVYGEYQNVKLTDDEYEKLIEEYGFNKTEAAIKKLDEYIEETGKKYQSHYLVLKRWVFDAIEERSAPPGPPGNQGGWSQRQPTRNEKWRTAGGHNSAENDALKMAAIQQSLAGNL